jgi:hypothetical protein
MSSLRSARNTRLEGSGTVPRVFAFAVLVIITVFLIVWIARDAGGLWFAIVVESLAIALAIRSLFVGAFFEGETLLVRAWFRDYRYAPGDISAVTAVPYWKFLDAKDPILALLKFTPTAGWVREVAATVSWRDRAAAQARTITERLEPRP